MFMPDYTRTTEEERIVDVRVDRFTLEASLSLPRGAQGLVLLAHTSGSERHNPRSRALAAALREGGLATLLMDLLTPAEEAIDKRTHDYRYDIDLLARRLAGATDWLGVFPETRRMRLGYFAAGTSAAAALVAAAERPELVGAIVARGGRPDLAGAALSEVQAPTLLLVDAGAEAEVELNREALALVPAEKRLDLVAQSAYDFESPAALDEIAQRARLWFERYLAL